MVVLPKERTSDGVFTPVSALVGQPVLGAGQQDDAHHDVIVVGIDRCDEDAPVAQFSSTSIRVVVAHGFKSLH